VTVPEIYFPSLHSESPREGEDSIRYEGTFFLDGSRAGTVTSMGKTRPFVHFYQQEDADLVIAALSALPPVQVGGSFWKPALSESFGILAIATRQLRILQSLLGSSVGVRSAGRDFRRGDWEKQNRSVNLERKYPQGVEILSLPDFVYLADILCRPEETPQFLR